METEVDASPEFLKFGRWFLQDIDRIASTQEQRYDFVLKPFEGEEHVRRRNVIERALHGSVSDGELQQLWRSTEADIHFHTAEGLRTMLLGARDRLQRPFGARSVRVPYPSRTCAP